MLFLLSPQCPKCQSDSLHRSRYKLYDQPLRLFRFVPARCGSCDRRYYVHRPGKLKSSSPNDRPRAN